MTKDEIVAKLHDIEWEDLYTYRIPEQDNIW